MARSLFLLAAAVGLCLGSSSAARAEDKPAAAPARTDGKPDANAPDAKTDAKTDAPTDDARPAKSDAPAKTAPHKTSDKPAFMDARKQREEANRQRILAQFDKNKNGVLDPDEREAVKRYNTQMRARAEAAAAAAAARSTQGRTVIPRRR